MNRNTLHKILTILIAAVWLVNGLVCKVLDIVPRHRQIVAEILGEEYSGLLTILIGISEIFMAIWVLSRFRSKINAVVQMIVVATMNVLEFLLVPELLLWGKLNFVFAMLFIGIIWYNEFVLNKDQDQ